MLLLDHKNSATILSLEKDDPLNIIFPRDHEFTMIDPRIKKQDWNFDAPSAPRLNFRRFFLGFIAAFVVGFSLWPFLPRYYQAQATLIFRYPEQSGKLTFLKQDLDEKAIQSELDILSSPPLTVEAIKRLNLQNDREFGAATPWAPLDFISNAISANIDPDPAHAALSRLSIQHDRRSYTIRIGFLSKDPKKSADMTAMLAALYLENLSDRKQKLLARDVDIARSRLLSTTFRQNQLSATINELTQLSPNQADKTAISDLIDEKARLAQTIDATRVQIEDAIVREQNAEPDAELIAPALYPVAPLFPNPLIFATAVLMAALIAGAGVSFIDYNRLDRMFRK